MNGWLSVCQGFYMASSSLLGIERNRYIYICLRVDLDRHSHQTKHSSQLFLNPCQGRIAIKMARHKDKPSLLASLERLMILLLLILLFACICVKKAVKVVEGQPLGVPLASSSHSLFIVSIQCPQGKSIYYKFKNTLVMGHQGLIQSQRGRMDNVETQLIGSMILTCPSRETMRRGLEISGMEASHQSVVMVTFERAQFLQYQGGKKKYRRLISRHDLTSKMIAHPMLFVMSPSGHIHSLVFKQSESRELRSIKKGLLRMLTTETVKSSRGQTDGFGGKYYQRYEKSHSSKFLTILQKYSKKDFIRIPLSKRRMQYEGMHVVNVSKDKHVVQSA